MVPPGTLRKAPTTSRPVENWDTETTTWESLQVPSDPAGWAANQVLTSKEEIELAEEMMANPPATFLRIDDPEKMTMAQQMSRIWKTREIWSTCVDQAQDTIHETLLADYRRFREASYECYKLGLTIYPASSASADMADGSSAIKFFTFQERGGWLPHTLPVMLVQGYDEGEVYARVRFQGKWRNFEAFCHYLYDQRDDFKSDPARPSELFSWWCENKKSFNLAGLPAEIRERIYKEAVRPADRLRVKPWTVKPNLYARWPRKGKLHADFAPDVAIMRTNKKFSYEAARVLYRTAIFEFEKPRQLEQFFCSIRGNVWSIKHIVLRFSWVDLLRFFGARLDGQRRYTPSHAAWTLKVMDLIKLEIQLPKIEDLISTRWLWDLENDVGCHRTTVSWIFDAARPFVQDLPVEFSGSVDFMQHQNFQSQIKIERQAAETRRVQLDKEKRSWCGSEVSSNLDFDSGVALPVEDFDSGYDTGSSSGIEEDYFSIHRRPSFFDRVEWENSRKVEIELPPRCTCATRCTLDD